MRTTFLDIARCPVCRTAGQLAAEAERTDEREVREGTAACGACGATRRIDRGIVDLMPADAPAFVRREAEGLERYAADMIRNGWTPERLVNLP